MFVKANMQGIVRKKILLDTSLERCCIITTLAMFCHWKIWDCFRPKQRTYLLPDENGKTGQFSLHLEATELLRTSWERLYPAQSQCFMSRYKINNVVYQVLKCLEQWARQWPFPSSCCTCMPGSLTENDILNTVTCLFQERWQKWLFTVIP